MRMPSFVLFTLLALLASVTHAQDISSLLEQARSYDFGKDSQALVALEQRIVTESKSEPSRISIAQKLGTELRRPDTTKGFKQFICRQLALTGTAAEVPFLAELLADPDLSDMARYALARIDDPRSDVVLRAALPGARGKILLGIIDTIGNRRDADASDQLVQMLSSPEPAVQAAVVTALGRVASSAAAEALRRRAETLPAPLPDGLADACLVAAERLSATPLREAHTLALSEQLLRAVFRKTTTPHFKAAALKGLLARGEKEDLSLLVETLKRGHADLQRAVAATVVPELGNLPQIDAVCGLFPQLPPDVQIIVLGAFAGYGSDAANAVATVREAVNSRDPGVRVAAIWALASLGDSSDLDKLISLALKGIPEDQRQAQKTLVLMSHPGVNARLAQLLAAGDEKSQTVLVEILGERQAREASSQLIDLARTRTGALARESIKALGLVGGPDELTPAVQIMLSSQAELQEEAVQAVVALARRAESESECSAMLAQKYEEAGVTPGARLAIVRVLGRLGAAPGLPVILAALKEPDPELSREAVTAASNWPDARPASDLLRIARESSDATQKVLALRGYLELVERDHDLSPDAKVRLYEASMALAPGDGEKQRVFSKLGQVASFSALNLAVKLAGNPPGEEAVAAAVSVAEKVYAENTGLARLIVERMMESTRNEKLAERCRNVLTQIEKQESGRPDSFPVFRVVPINPDSRFEAAAMVDINRDGRLDIYCGGFWYRAPDWTRHWVRPVAEQDGFFLDLGAIPADIDGDGWTDIVSGSWHGKDVFWIRNHGGTGVPFETIEIDQPGNLETLIRLDINGDSRPDFLPNTVQSIHWYEFRRDADVAFAARWIRHDLPGGAAGHGVGAGDINGDGRVDIVSPRGWLEQPRRAEVPWIWHPQFDLGSASVPILVCDVNRDHYPDLVYGNAHGYGLYWLEQAPVGEKVQWQNHPIDTTWSQPHFLLQADLDGDGMEEIVTGKRYYAHNGNDPGADHPLCVYAYRYDARTDKWSRHRVHEGGRVGFGISTMAGDIDKDGDMDLLAPGKSGLYLLENQLRK
ncbi:MAG: HEAT repeat domain-containing protein [Acidobacteriota bacterium]